jgi:hypothetical protein
MLEALLLVKKLQKLLVVEKLQRLRLNKLTLVLKAAMVMMPEVLP